MTKASRRWTRSFASDERGVSAVEAALVLPVLIVVLLGAALFAVIYLESKASDRATSIVADLVARQTTVDAAFLKRMEAVYKSLLRKSDNFVSFRISTVKYEDDKLTVEWSYASGVGALNQGQAKTLPLPTIANSDSLVVVETSAKATTLLNPMKFKINDITNVIAARPRFTAVIAKTD